MTPLRRHGAAFLLALISFALLRIASVDTGYVRDEAAYVEASLKIRTWFSQLQQDPARALDTRDRTFRYNNEHPVLLKGLAALAVEDQGKSRDTLPGQALRIAAQLVAALGVYAITAVGIARYGLAIGLFCGLAFISLPRVFYHAQLHCFDVSIATAAFLVSLLFSRLVRNPGFASAGALGLGFGLSLGIKHNALLFPAFLLSALAWAWLEEGTTRKRAGRLLAFGMVAVGIGVLVFWASWPWLWRDPLSRWLAYLDFHRDHSYYNMAFLGKNYNQPPLPWSYPWVLTGATWPLSWLLLVLGGIGLAIARRHQKEEHLNARVDLVMAMAPLLLISLPSIPIFGGTKHWITAYPFLCLHMGRSLRALLDAMNTRPLKFQIALNAGGLVLLSSPAIVDNLRSHPHQLGQYASWMGGPRAAARVGLGRGFWGGMCVPRALAFIDSEKTGDPTLFTHDMHGYLLGAYKADGWTQELTATSRRKAKFALHFYENHMLIDEIWTQRAGYGTRPRWVCTLDDVPLAALYEKTKESSP